MTLPATTAALASFLAPATLLAATPPAPAAAKPNIVIIYMDDMGYADIGPFGADPALTPNLNRMAAEGMRFTSFYSAQAVCSASRCGILTGCYPNRVGITGALPPHAGVGLAAQETTIAELCKGQGYATAIFGKWHLGDARPFLPLQQGFDEYFGLPYSNDMTPHQRWDGDTRHVGYVKLPLISQNTVVNPDLDNRGQDMLTTWYTEHATDFIRRHREQPFFLYVPHSMMHIPLHVSDKFRGKSGKGLYADVTMEIDWSVGQILDTLKETGLDDRTLVMFCSDNGPWLCFGEHGGSARPLREGKGTSWDGGIREPTIMRWPGHIPAGRSCDAPLCTIDMLPTVARLAGAPLPKLKIDGLDIADVITGKTDQSPHEALFFYYHKNDLEAMRSGRWKLEFARAYNSLDGKPGHKDGSPVPYASLKIRAPQLYDLDADPGEKTDVAAQHPEVMQKLTALAGQMRKELGDSLAKQKGDGRREPGKAGKDAIYPSSPEFEKAIDARYQPQ